MSILTTLLALLPIPAVWVFGRCEQDVQAPVQWVPPPPRQVPAAQQAQAIIAAWQEAGETGVIGRGRILRRYAEHCEMFGFVPVAHNALCEALGRICEKKRVWTDGHYITAYRIPDAPRADNICVFPNGKEEDEIPFDLPKRARAGTSYAQA
jgi:hypothetical protein